MNIKIISVFCLLLIFFPVFSQDMPDFEELIKKINEQINNGTFNKDDYDLSKYNENKEDIDNFDWESVLGGGNNMDFEEGGNVGSVLGGGSSGYGGGLMNSLGISTIHIDGALSTNLAAAALFVKNKMHPQIADRQQKIISLQEDINNKVLKLYMLETKTQNYLEKTQSDVVEIEDISNFTKITSDIGTYYNLCVKHCDNGGFSQTKDVLNKKIASRFLEIYSKVAQFAKKDGKNNLLNNLSRDEIIAYVYSNLRDMRKILAIAERELNIAAKAKQIENLNK